MPRPSKSCQSVRLSWESSWIVGSLGRQSGRCVGISTGEIKQCPLCIVGKNDEIHLVTQCPQLQLARSRIKLGKRETLASCLDIGRPFKPESLQELLRLFLGQELDLMSTQLIHRGFALERLVDTFFKQWSEKLNRTISRKPGLVLASHLLIVDSLLNFFLFYYSDKSIYYCEDMFRTYISSHTSQ